MNFRLSFLFDIAYLAIFLFHFLGETNQKYFRNDAIGFGCLFYTFYVIWSYKKRRFNFQSLFHLFFIILLSNFVFLKISEYDPIQLLPEKLVIKLTMSFWNFLILYHHFHSEEKDYYLFGTLLAILPCFVCTNYMMYPVVPIGFAIGLMIRYISIDEMRSSKILPLFLTIVLFWIIRDWNDDFALVRVLLFSEVVIILFLIKHLEKSFVKKIAIHILLIFLINSIILLSKMYLDSEFKIKSFREDLFLIPVSLIGSNSFLILGLVAFSFPGSAWRSKLFYLIVLVIASFFLLLSLSRISIVSAGLLFLYIIWEKQKERINVKFVIFAVSLFVFSFVFLLLSEKSLLNFETIGIRFSIWKLHFLSTIYNKPFFGFGFNSEKLLPFADVLNISVLDFALVKDYMYHFKTFPLAHNLFFQIFSATGIFGFSLLLGWLWILFGKSSGNNRSAYSSESFSRIILLVWLIHEILDFSSLEIANVLILGLFVLNAERSREINGIEINSINYSKLNKSFVILYCLVVLFLSYRFSRIEQLIFNHHRDITLSTFMEFTPNERALKDKINVRDRELSNVEITFFGERYFFLNLALAKSSKQEPKMLQQCFDNISRKELCYTNLLGYMKNQKELNRFSDPIGVFLLLGDPFGIYSQDFL